MQELPLPKWWLDVFNYIATDLHMINGRISVFLGFYEYYIGHVKITCRAYQQYGEDKDQAADCARLSLDEETEQIQH